MLQVVYEGPSNGVLEYFPSVVPIYCCLVLSKCLESIDHTDLWYLRHEHRLVSKDQHSYLVHLVRTRTCVLHQWLSNLSVLMNQLEIYWSAGFWFSKSGVGPEVLHYQQGSWCCWCCQSATYTLLQGSRESFIKTLVHRLFKDIIWSLFFPVLGIELRTTFRQGKCSTAELHPAWASSCKLISLSRKMQKRHFGKYS